MEYLDHSDQFGLWLCGLVCVGSNSDYRTDPLSLKLDYSLLLPHGFKPVGLHRSYLGAHFVAVEPGHANITQHKSERARAAWLQQPLLEAIHCLSACFECLGHDTHVFQHHLQRQKVEIFVVTQKHCCGAEVGAHRLRKLLLLRKFSVDFEGTYGQLIWVHPECNLLNWFFWFPSLQLLGFRKVILTHLSALFLQKLRFVSFQGHLELPLLYFLALFLNELLEFRLLLTELLIKFLLCGIKHCLAFAVFQLRFTIWDYIVFHFVGIWSFLRTFGKT